MGRKVSTMKLNFKKLHETAVIPQYAKEGDAGLDLTAIAFKSDDGVITYRTGLAVEVPEGHVGLLFPRSSVYKTWMTMSNSVGVIDSGYRGELMIKFNLATGCTPYMNGDRVAQLVVMPIPFVEVQEVTELSETNRGAGGFGSTGN
jgi:dUTP pyrophosphatase